MIRKEPNNERTQYFVGILFGVVIEVEIKVGRVIT